MTWTSPIGRFTWAISIFFGVWPILWAAPQVPRTLRTGIAAPRELYLGTPFSVIVEVIATPETKWEKLLTPRRYGQFTLRAFEVRPKEGNNPDQWLLTLEFQAFRIGEVSVPKVPLRYFTPEIGSGEADWVPPVVRIQERLSGEGPQAARLTHGGFPLPESNAWRWWALAGGVALILAFPVYRWMKNRHRAENNRASSIQQPDLSGFLAELETIWIRGRTVANSRALAAEMMDLFRRDLEWRFVLDLSAFTSVETLLALREKRGEDEINWERLEKLLHFGEYACFAPESVDLRPLYSGLKEMIASLGSPQSLEEGGSDPLSVAS